jgi:hypothetical protein
MKKLLLSLVAFLFLATAASAQPPPCVGNNVCVGPGGFGSLFLITDGQERVEITAAGVWVSNIDVTFGELTVDSLTTPELTATAGTITTLTATTATIGTLTLSGDPPNGMCKLIDSSTTETGTAADTNETTMHETTVPAGTLATDGSYLRVRAFGSIAAGGGTKTIRTRFGATANPAQVVLISTATNTIGWVMEGDIVRTGAATQKVFGRTGFGTAGNVPSAVAATQTLANELVVRVTATNGAAAENDILFSYAQVYLCLPE